MFNSILSKYDPKDIRSHGILSFFVDDLNENEKIEFVDLIFKKGSWGLPTEICKLSDSIQLKEKTNQKFLQIFNDWVDERIKYSSKISKKAKNPLVTIDLTTEFREILLSIRNLNFSLEIMDVLKRFFDNSNQLYIKNFFRNSLSIIIEEYNEKEIEFFFSYFSNEYNDNISTNYCVFVHAFLEKLAYSYKMHDLSDSFLDLLSNLSLSLKKNLFNSDYSIVITIFLIDLIIEKKLDLSNSRHDKIISETISQLKKSDYANLEFFRFLKRFNYPFNNNDFHSEIESFFYGIGNNISILKNCNDEYKRDILHHYLKFSNNYFETLLFFLEQLSEKEAEEYFIKFVDLIDELRNSFLTLLWFDEFLNFKKISGNIVAVTSKGFEVKIDDNIFNDNIQLKEPQLTLSKKIKSHYGFGFLHESSLNADKARGLHDFFSNNCTDVASNEIISFYILNLNYSHVYKGKVIQFVPESKLINKLISKYNLKALFVSIEIYLIEKAYKYLNFKSPFPKRTNQFKILCTQDYIYNYNIGFSENTFWNMLKRTRPLLYQSLYITHKENEKLFEQITIAYQNQTPINGVVKSKTNGGMIVDLLGLEAFLPGSQIDIKPISDYDKYIDKIMKFKIIQLNSELKNIVVSHRVLFEADLELKTKNIIDQLEKGQILEGFVKNITSYGVFIDLGGVDGLIHITDLTWSRINHPSEVVELEQKINVIILDFDLDKTRIQLGLKQLAINVWDNIEQKIQVGDKIIGKVVSILNYGAVIEVIEGVEGFVHSSDLSWEIKITNPANFLKIGDNLDVIVLDLDVKNRKLYLGHKQTIENPWDKHVIDFAKGTVHYGTIKVFVNKGAIVCFKDNVTAFTPLHHLKKEDGGSLKKGESAYFKVIEFNKNRQRILVSHTFTFNEQFNTLLKKKNNKKISLNGKYLKNSKEFMTNKSNSKSSFNNYKIGDKIKGTVFEIADYGAYIKLADGTESLIKVSEMSWKSKLCYAQDFMKLGDIVEAVIVFVENSPYKIFSSVKRLK